MIYLEYPSIASVEFFGRSTWLPVAEFTTKNITVGLEYDESLWAASGINPKSNINQIAVVLFYCE